MWILAENCISLSDRKLLVCYQNVYRVLSLQSSCVILLIIQSTTYFGFCHVIRYI